MALYILNNIDTLYGGSISPYLGGGQGNWFYIDYSSLIACSDETPEVNSFYVTRIFDFEVEFLKDGIWYPFSQITKKIIFVPSLSGISTTYQNTYFYTLLIRVKAPYINYGNIPFFYVRALTNKLSPSSNYWSIKELAVYCNIVYTNTAPVLNYVDILDTLTPDKFFIPYDLILQNSDGSDLETKPVFLIKTIYYGSCFKSGVAIEAPFYLYPNEYFTWSYPSSVDEIVQAFSLVLIDFNDVSNEIIVNVHCKLPILDDTFGLVTLTEYLQIFDKKLSDNNVKCFKCGSPLQQINDNLECENSHIFTYKQYFTEHATFQSGLLVELSQKRLCGVQMEK